MPLDSIKSATAAFTFKLGDRVKVTQENARGATVKAGDTGVIVKVPTNARGDYRVKMDTFRGGTRHSSFAENGWFFDDKVLEALTIPAAPMKALDDALRALEEAAKPGTKFPLATLRSATKAVLDAARAAGMMRPKVNPEDWKAATPQGYGTVAYWLARHKPDLMDKGGTYGAQVARLWPAGEGVLYAKSSKAEQELGFQTCRTYPGPWLHSQMVDLTA